jgi:membrane protease YdiL (CAAX protease family)
VSSLLFGAMHLGYWLLDEKALSIRAVAHASSMILAGIIFGGIAQRSKSLLGPIAVHVLANSLVLSVQAASG